MVRDTLLSPTGIRLRTIIGVMLILAALIATPLLTKLSVDNSLARWAEQGTRTPALNPESHEVFEDLVIVLIQVSGDSLFTEKSLDTLVEAFEAIESIPDVIRVEGVPALFRDQYGLEDIEALEEEMRNSPYFQKFYVSPDLKHMGFFVVLESEDSGYSDKIILEEITHTTQSLEEKGFSVTTVGPVVMNAELDRLSLQESLRLFPIALGLSSLILFLLLRSLSAALVAILSAGLTLILLLECVVLSGYSLNMITVAMPPLIWVLSLSASIHMLHRFLKEQHIQDDVNGSIHAALLETAYPNSFASLTTALGFLSLRVSEMLPVQELGTFVALGMILTIAVNLTFTPLLLRIFSPKQRGKKSLHHTDSRLHIHPRTILAIVVCVVLLIIPGMFKIRSQSNPLSMFSPDSRVHQQYAALSKELAAPATLETIVQLPTSWQDPETWPVIEQVVHTLDSRAIAIKTLSPLDGLRLLNQWETGQGVEGYQLPESREQAEDLLKHLEDFDSNPLQQLIHQSGSEIRMITFVNEMDSGVFLDYVDEVNHTLDTLPAGYSGYTTGTVLHIVRAQRNLVTYQYQSFGLAFGVIFICMFLGLRSWRLLLLSIPPNILPIAVVFGLMGYLDIPLNTGSVMVASVVLGIGVDDTVHMLVAISRASKLNESRSTVVYTTIGAISPALITTTSVIGGGFLVLAFSKFVPLVHFGVLATLAIFVALWADLRLVPALLLFRHKDQQNHE